MEEKYTRNAKLYLARRDEKLSFIKLAKQFKMSRQCASYIYKLVKRKWKKYRVLITDLTLAGKGVK